MAVIGALPVTWAKCRALIGPGTLNSVVIGRPASPARVTLPSLVRCWVTLKNKVHATHGPMMNVTNQIIPIKYDKSFKFGDN
jgi:hypothetical protein